MESGVSSLVEIIGYYVSSMINKTTKLSLLVIFSICLICPKAFADESAMDKFALANKLYDKGSYHASVIFYDKCLKLNPSYYPAYVKRGDALRKLGKTKWAREDYQEALKLNPRCAEAKAGLRSLGKGKKRKRKRSRKKSSVSKAKKATGFSRLRTTTKKRKKVKPPTSD